MKFALRQLLRKPGFTAVAVLTLALGIGANTAIFSLLNAVMIRRLPVVQPERLVLFGNGSSAGSTDSFPDANWNLFSYPMFKDIRQNVQALDGLAAIKSLLLGVHGRLEGASGLDKFETELVSGSYFSVLGVKPWMGRLFSDDDDRSPGGHPLAIMSYRMWSRRCGSDPNVVGKRLTLGSTAYTVIGVTPPQFFGTSVGQSPDLWVPLAMEAQISPGWHGLENKLFQSLYLLGRLKPELSLKSGEAAVNVAFQQLLHDYAGTQPTSQQLENMRRARIDLTPAATGLSRLRFRFSAPLHILMTIVCLVLLIACANLANLMLARATSRHREISIRLAIGAKRWQVVRQLLIESVVLALAGGACGTLFAWWASHLLLHLVSPGAQELPLEVSPDRYVLAFTLVLLILTAILFGLVPALRATRIQFDLALKDGKASSPPANSALLGRALVIGQVALSLALLICSGLFLRSLMKTVNQEIGFDKDNVLVFSVDESPAGYKEDQRLENLYRQIEEKVSAVTGVRAASFSFFTFDQGSWTSPIYSAAAEHMPVSERVVCHNVIGPGYFAAMGIPRLLGRPFGSMDTENSPRVAIVNETFARRFFPNEPALGQHFRLGGPDADTSNEREIVGIVKDAKYESLRETARPAAYYPHAQRIQYLGNFEVRYVGDSATVVATVRRALAEVDPNLPVSEVTTLAHQVDRSIVDQKLIAQLSTFFGALAVALASLGIYGLTSYGVSRRTREIGIRIALGARPWGVLWLILRETLMLAVIGIAIGLIASFAAQRLISSQLYGMNGIDPICLGAAIVFLALVASFAGYLPARRATKVDPIAALRYE